jgi:hypothetical protein
MQSQHGQTQSKQAKRASLDDLGPRTDGILRPPSTVDPAKWAVVACDQYTSEPEYWHRLEQQVGDAPSTLRLIFPEVWLERESGSEKAARIARINDTMRAYLADNLLVPVGGPVLTERVTRQGKTRVGLVVSIDLEQYDFSVGSQSLVRATEGTILDRLPPRIRIREHAALELPHIMILIDDPDKRVIEPLHAAARASGADGKDGMRPVYDFDLLENSGHLRGWAIQDDALLQEMTQALSDLARPDTFRSRYALSGEAGVLLYAVGDGNHSLATAKSCWEQRKQSLSEAERQSHPARHALVELVNVHDDGLLFEPIHRVVFGASRESFLEDFHAWHAERGLRLSVGGTDADTQGDAGVSVQSCVIISGNKEESLLWHNPQQQLAVGSLQAFLDAWLPAHPEAAIDYVHGDDVVRRHAQTPGNLGFLLPVMGKEELFPTVIRDGALPRKTFSMGEAHEKRFYLECRRILP